jgi:thiamine-monophosphate kinase
MELFTTHFNKSVASIGESALIEQIKVWLGDTTLKAPYGIGDDCAVIKSNSVGHTLLTVDSLVYRHHFDDSVPAHLLGKKLVRRNLSDIAAMGGRAEYAVIALLLSSTTRLEWIHEFYEGIREDCAYFNLKVIGGDISECSLGSFSASMTIVGKATRPLIRKGAKPGDLIFVTGELGGSISGKHIHFMPRLDEGEWLANRPEVVAMLDITDGLSKDLPELIPAKCAAYLNIDDLPISKAAYEQAKTSKESACTHALNDGEDYELLFAVNKDTPIKPFIKEWKKVFKTPLQHIGTFEKNPTHFAQLLDAKTHKPLIHTQGQGYQHLSRKCSKVTGR